MTPAEALSVAAQIAVALAGFAGVAAAFGKGALHVWSQDDKLRLRLLLTTGLLPLAWSLGALLLLSAGLAQPLTWRICSAVSAVMLISGMAPIASTVRRVANRPTSDVSRVLFFSSAAIGVMVAALQAYNLIAWGAFWPFFAMIVVSMLVCIVQFARLILRQPG